MFVNLHLQKVEQNLSFFFNSFKANLAKFKEFGTLFLIILEVKIKFLRCLQFFFDVKLLIKVNNRKLLVTEVKVHNSL